MYKSEVYGSGGIYAKVVAHSSHKGQELITVETYAPKFLDAEVEKHRMISSNSSSDRAVPLRKMIERDPFIPEDVRLNQKGMQGFKRLEGNILRYFQEHSKGLYRLICQEVEAMSDDYGVHKQHLNRYLLGFSMQSKVMTANRDQWDYFFSLRLADEADPAIQELARCIKEAIEQSEPEELEVGQWHLPYFSVSPWEVCNEFGDLTATEDAIKCSVARCARVSYLNHDNSKPNIEKDVALHDMLLEHKHFSCFEHVATPMEMPTESSRKDGFGVLKQKEGWTHIDKVGNYWSGNFHSYIQYRQLVQ